MARSRISQICRFCVTGGVPRRSLLVALVVGTILNLINQGDALFEHALGFRQAVDVPPHRLAVSHVSRRKAAGSLGQTTVQRSQEPGAPTVSGKC